MKVIDLKGISKKYDISHERKMIAKAVFFGWRNHKQTTSLWALKNIGLEINKGEVVGIIGENGSGKSTLLKILSGVTIPSCGSIQIHGKVSSLLELGTGFHPDLTGRENIYLNASLLGLKRKEINLKFDEIVDFSGLREFMDTPLRNYSSGMYLRLGFSAAMCVASDILIIDEVLSVGDEAFQRECIKKIKEFKNSGRTIIFVSHDLDMVLSLCDRAIFIKEGKIFKDGKPFEVVDFYLATVGRRKGTGILQNKDLSVIFNNGKMSIYYASQALTKDSGCFSVIGSGDKYYSSHVFSWEVVKVTDASLEAEGELKNPGLTQKWSICLNDHFINWDVKACPKNNTAVDKLQINLMISDDYDNWFTAQKKEPFLEISTSARNWQPLLLEGTIIKCLGAVSSGKKRKLPVVLFEQKDTSISSGTDIFNTDFQSNARVLQHSLPFDNHSQEVVFNGKIMFFESHPEAYFLKKIEEFYKDISSDDEDMRLVFDNKKPWLFWKDMELPETNPIVKSCMARLIEEIYAQEDVKLVIPFSKEDYRIFWKGMELPCDDLAINYIRSKSAELAPHNEDLKIIFENGRIRIFWRGTEITKSIGFYLSFYNNFQWHDSISSEWKIIEKEEKKIVVSGKSREPALAQIWQAEIYGNRLLLKVKVEPGQGISIEQHRVCCLVQDKYNSWFTRDCKGEFPIDFSSYWVDVLDKNIFGDFLGAECAKNSLALPRITMRLSPETERYLVRISNTDFNSSARALQLLKFEIGEGQSFETNITFEEV